MSDYTMKIIDARSGRAPQDLHVFLSDPLWGDNTFKVYENYWTGAMFGTYKWYTNTKSIQFTSTFRPGLVYPGEKISDEPYVWMIWDFVNYPNDCKEGAGRSGEGTVWTNFFPDIDNPIRWTST